MADREKVIKGLNSCPKLPFDLCFAECLNIDCPYYNESGIKKLHQDAVVLLKEQETEWEHLWDAPDGTFKGRCKKCGFVHLFIEGHDTQYKFCPECGKKVKWE